MPDGRKIDRCRGSRMIRDETINNKFTDSPASPVNIPRAPPKAWFMIAQDQVLTVLMTAAGAIMKFIIWHVDNS